jgi:hypothetical protein
LQSLPKFVKINKTNVNDAFYGFPVINGNEYEMHSLMNQVIRNMDGVIKSGMEGYLVRNRQNRADLFFLTKTRAVIIEMKYNQPSGTQVDAQTALASI